MVGCSACVTSSYVAAENRFYESEMTLAQKRDVSSMPVRKIKYLADSVLCEASVSESDYVPSVEISNEIIRRGLVCQLFESKNENTMTIKEQTTEQALRQCFVLAQRRERSCALSAYGGVSSISNPIVRRRQQACTDQRMSAEEHCLRMHNPSALKGVPARVPAQQTPQVQQIVIEKPSLNKELPRVGPIVPGATPYQR